MKEDMMGTILRIIVDKFKEQERLYHEMKDLSCQQLALLKQGAVPGSVELKKLLQQRWALMDKIYALNEEAGRLQKQAINDLNLPAFTLSAMESMVPAEDFQALKLVIDDLAAILRDISECDSNNMRLMQKGIYQSDRTGVGSQKQAESAYRQVMKQIPPKTDEHN